MKGKKLVSLSMAAVMCAGGLAVYGGQEVKADDKVSVVVATNWGEGDSKLRLLLSCFSEIPGRKC